MVIGLLDADPPPLRGRPPPQDGQSSRPCGPLFGRGPDALKGIGIIPCIDREFRVVTSSSGPVNESTNRDPREVFLATNTTHDTAQTAAGNAFLMDVDRRQWPAAFHLTVPLLPP